MAISLVSPGIEVTETDLSTVVPSTATLEGGIAGVFSWGPVLEPIKVSSEVDLAKRFGGPKTGFNVETFFTAADFLSYSNALYVVRVSDGVKAESADEYVTAKYEGDAGNGVRVVIANNTAFTNVEAGVQSLFDRAPSSNTNVNVAIIDGAGSFGAVGGVLEIYEDLSILEGAKTEDGTNNNLRDVINTRSRYIDLDEVVLLSNLLDYDEVLIGGSDGSDESTIAMSDLYAGYEKFENSEDIDISLLMQGKARGVASKTELAQWIMDNVIDARRDCMLFISPDRDDVVNNAGNEAAAIVAFRNEFNFGGYLGSFAVMDSGYKYRYDKYNDRYVYTPLNGDMAGLCVRTDQVADPWFSPAGYNRGFIKNVVKLAYNPKKADRDTLYKADVNPVMTQAGQGTLLFGDKTLMGRQSAFSRINVRRLFIILQRSISSAARFSLFEFNDDFTRRQFVNIVEPFLREIQGRRGIFDFRVVCDETNNTSEVIERNEFIGDIYVKPARSINFIQLNFVAVRTGIAFEEIVGRF